MDESRDQTAEPTEGAEPTLARKPTRARKPAVARKSTKAPAPDPTPTDTGAPSPNEMTLALTPSQLAVGGAIVAGLLVVGVRLLLGRRRGRG